MTHGEWQWMQNENTAVKSSFELDEICRDNLRRAGAPVADYAEPTLTHAVDRLVVSHRRYVRAVASFCIAGGIFAGILATLAVQHIFGAA